MSMEDVIVYNQAMGYSITKEGLKALRKANSQGDDKAQEAYKRTLVLQINQL